MRIRSQAKHMPLAAAVQHEHTLAPPACPATCCAHSPPSVATHSPPPDAVAKQLRIRLVPDMVDLQGERLRVVGEYRLPLKLALPGGERAALNVTVSST